ncbi:protein-cysteine N-palmitoyltransferase HHAT-like [Saccoglossus kowalevskii]|uniref:Protein-cysteine N-palmitoyltransferase HHAT-like n=1 Tax=Saccoglossus kowalevskii TaxID=10224 RepID=A0ABM0M422_SACKO|nr:PREDICTED: protein-cysteine N-palmitoyltransferase HHAT-like [Saccoglossus kowalevskii]
MPNRSAIRLVTVIEYFVYGCIWYGALGYSLYRAYTVTRDKWHTLYEYDLEDGWKVFEGRKKDIADFEWKFWTDALFTLPVFLGILGHIVIGWFSTTFLPQYRQHLLLAYSLVSFYLVLGNLSFGFILANAIIMYTVSLLKMPSLCWITGLLQLVIVNHDPMKSWQSDLYEDEDEYYLMVFTLAMSYLRFLSFALEYCKLPSNGEHTHPGLFDYLVYIFYYPLFFCGPVMTFDTFYKQMNEVPTNLTKTEFIAICKNLLRVLFWTLFIEVGLHFVYFTAFHRNLYLFKYLPTWSLAGIGFTHVQFFHVKYVVMYGLPHTLALFDHINSPKQPACVAALYTFKDMWRYFDKGLHVWLMKYIYCPLGGSRHGLFYQLISSLSCFMYVAYWHGGESHLYIWCLLNWLGVSMETLGNMFLDLKLVENVRTQLPECFVHRLKAVVMSPSFIMAVISNLVFLGGNTLGSIYFNRIFQDGWPNTTLWFVLVFYCQIMLVSKLQTRWNYF